MIDSSGILSLIFTSSSLLTSLCKLALPTLLNPFSSSYILLVSLIQVLGTLLRFSK